MKNKKKFTKMITICYFIIALVCIAYLIKGAFVLGHIHAGLHLSKHQEVCEQMGLEYVNSTETCIVTVGEEKNNCYTVKNFNNLIICSEEEPTFKDKLSLAVLSIKLGEKIR
jgi:hypothetical protein